MTELPFVLAGNTHSIVIDIVQDDGSVDHQIIALKFGENNARMDADLLNRWRDQTAVAN